MIAPQRSHLSTHTHSTYAHPPSNIISISRKLQLERKFSKVIAQLFVKFNYPFRMMTIKAKFSTHSFFSFLFLCHCYDIMIYLHLSYSISSVYFSIWHLHILPALYSVVHVEQQISYIASMLEEEQYVFRSLITSMYSTHAYGSSYHELKN